MSAFSLHPQLAADCLHVKDLSLCRLLLMNDARFPWLILVPMRGGVREIFDLPAQERALLMEEASQVAQALQELTGAKKINIAALGNMVPQLHVHVIARFEEDEAWPRPVWGVGERRLYAEAESKAIIEKFLSC